MSDRAQFLELFFRHEQETRAFIRSVVRGYQNYEDVFQEVALVLWECYEQFDPQRSSFGAWARGIAVNKVLRHRRKEGRAPQLFSPEAIAMLGKAFEHEERRHPAESMDALERCIEELPPRSRELLALRYEKRLTAIEMGERLNQSRWAIHKSLSRIRAVVARCIERRLSGTEANG